jgi:hypothetical protein
VAVTAVPKDTQPILVYTGYDTQCNIAEWRRRRRRVSIDRGGAMDEEMRALLEEADVTHTHTHTHTHTARTAALLPRRHRHA